MNNIKISKKCSYCKSYIKTSVEPFNEADIKLLYSIIEIKTLLCRKCAKDSEARIWLSNYIMSNN